LGAVHHSWDHSPTHVDSVAITPVAMNRIFSLWHAKNTDLNQLLAGKRAAS
jgi:hypothetical protein